MVNIPIHIQF